MRVRYLAAAVFGVALPVLAQPLTPGWIMDPSSGCSVWNLHPGPNQAISWSGKCLKGWAEGRGVLQWFWNGKPWSRYDGELRDGKMNGRGVQTWPNGDRYDGEWRDGYENGRGVYSWANGDRYEGELRDGKQDGRGVMTKTNGDRYDGQWHEGKAHGVGALKKDGQVYSGTWTNGCFRQGEQRHAVGVTPEECGSK